MLLLPALSALLAVSAADAATPVFGSVAGKVTAISGTRFTITSATGSSVIVTRTATRFTRNGIGSRSDLAVGTCATAAGEKPKQGLPTAMFINLSPTVNGACAGPGSGQAVPPGPRPRSGQQPPSGQQPNGALPFQPENVVFGNGKITAVKVATITVKGPERTVSFLVAATTRISKTNRVTRSAVATGRCALVRGTTTDNGKTVLAQGVALLQAVNGSCARLGPRFSYDENGSRILVRATHPDVRAECRRSRIRTSPNPKTVDRLTFDVPSVIDTRLAGDQQG
jgi:hypothetical protein